MPRRRSQSCSRSRRSHRPAERAVDQRREAADGGHSGERAAERADAGAQQLRLAAQALEAARGTIARALDALQALLAVLADRDQLGLDLAAALDRQTDGIGVSASGHGSGISRWLRREQEAGGGTLKGATLRRPVSGPLRTRREPGPVERTSQKRNSHASLPTRAIRLQYAFLVTLIAPAQVELFPRLRHHRNGSNDGCRQEAFGRASSVGVLRRGFFQRA